MRSSIILLAMLLGAVSATAGDVQLSVFTSNPSYTESSGNSRWNAGVGLALSKTWNERWSTEFAVAKEQHRAPYTRFQILPFQSGDQLIPVTGYRSFRVFPIDLTTQYRFQNDSRWTPYVSAGLRYVASPDGGRTTVIANTPAGLTPVNGGFAFDRSRTSAEIGGGVQLRLTPHVGLRFDVMRLLRSDSISYDPLTKASLGVGFKF
ncbi:MAG: outer membrane beta-barrel protein [Acidobacteriota bacterium]